jgi:hypothetical protein
MGAFDYGAEAELFSAPGRASRRQPIGYRRFATAAEAIRFAIEELAPASLAGAYLEVGEERFDSRDMRRLYEAPDYPPALRKREAPAAVPGPAEDSGRLSPPARKTGVPGTKSSRIGPHLSTSAKRTSS